MVFSMFVPRCSDVEDVRVWFRFTNTKVRVGKVCVRKKTRSTGLSDSEPRLVLFGCSLSELVHVDPGLINPCLLIWGVSPVFVGMHHFWRGKPPY